MLSKVASLVVFIATLPSGAGFLPTAGGGLARSLDGRGVRVVPTRRPILVPLYVFDFFRDRAKEGFEQLENIATKTKEVIGLIYIIQTTLMLLMPCVLKFSTSRRSFHDIESKCD